MSELSARQQRAADKQAEQQAADQRRAEEVFAAGPIGRAEAAHANGDVFFQVQLSVSQLTGPPSAFGLSGNRISTVSGSVDVLAEIEARGWHLEHAGYVFIETGATSTNRVFGTGQGVVTRGGVAGVYLFRRVPSAR